MAIPRVLLSYVHRPMCVGLFFRAAFRQAGVDVRSIGPDCPEVYNTHFVDGDYAPPDWPVLDSSPRQVAGIEAAAQQDGWVPDAVVWVDQYDPYIAIGRPTCPWAHIAVENWNEEQARRAHGREGAHEYYMIHHDTFGTVVPPALPDGATFLPFGFDPFIHPLERPLETPRGLLVCQIGTAYEPRPTVWDHCRQWVDGVGPLGKSTYDTGLAVSTRTAFGRTPSYRTFAKVYNDALLALSCSNVDFLPMRAPEAMGMGCLLVSDDVPTLRAVYGPPWVQCVHGTIDTVNPRGTWLAYDRSMESLHEVLDWAQWSLDHDAGTPIVAARTRAVAQAYSGHTYAHRARQILNDLGLGNARAYRSL